MKQVTVKGYPFVSHVKQVETEHTFDVYAIFKSKHHMFADNVKRYGYVRLMGYAYDLRPYLNKYLFKQYGHWWEAYAPNKTLLRQSTYGRIDQIIQLN